MVRAEGISKSYGEQSLFCELSCDIFDADRIALVGPNGIGKSTLLKILDGRTSPDSGSVVFSKGLSTGYLPQEGIQYKGKSILQEALTAFSDLLEVRHHARELEEKMAQTSGKEESERLLKKYEQAHQIIDSTDGFTIERRAQEVLCGLGFEKEQLDDQVETLSGGWQMRVALAKLLLANPEVLLLDEPTNHLDLESITWLERFLDDFEGSIVMVCHDRYFVESIATRIWELSANGFTDYRMNYSTYLKEREALEERLEQKKKEQDDYIEKEKTYISRFRYKKDKARQVQNRIRRLENLEKVRLLKNDRVIRFSFPQPERSGRIVVRLNGVSKSYGSNAVLSSVDLEVERGQKISIVGPNGAGKTTLMKILAGLNEYQGERVLGHKVNVQYFSQEAIDMLNARNTVLREIEEIVPYEPLTKLRRLLGALLFTGDDVFKKVSVLSGGEKSRLALAKMLVRPGNFLLLDEPTNHLDMESREILKDALVDFSGTVCLVSHDRYLIDSVADKLIQVRRGKLREFLGNYSELLLEAEPDQRLSASRQAEHSRAHRQKKKRHEAELRHEAYQKRKEREAVLEKVEKKILEIEERIEALDVSLSDPVTYKDGEKAKNIVTEREQLACELDRLYSEWEDAVQR
jgi:ATP-binding cassette subfamily F protein 3